MDSLVCDYLTLERQRTTHRPYFKVLGGLAVLVILGALFGRVPIGEAEIFSALLVLPLLSLALIEIIQSYRLNRKLRAARAAVQARKVIKKS